MSGFVAQEDGTYKGLNPCCNGIYSMSLILFILLIIKLLVLILVVMEYTQWVAAIPMLAAGLGLNPCCNGIYSMSALFFSSKAELVVLILVVMEYTQWAIILFIVIYLSGS